MKLKIFKSRRTIIHDSILVNIANLTNQKEIKTRAQYEDIVELQESIKDWKM